MEMYDLLIVGAGPAGITAAIYASRKRMNLLVVTGDIGGQAAWSGEVENYTGYQFISGAELVGKFQEHMETYNIPVRQGEKVTRLEKTGDIVTVTTDKGEYKARACVIASGKRSRELDVPGEREYRNRGVSYCATCDAPLFAGRDVVVVGGGNSALDAALQLIRIADRVYVVNNTSVLGGDAIMRGKVTGSAKVTVYNNSQVTGVSGETLVTGVDVRTEEGDITIEAQGVFIEAGLVPNSDFTRGIEKNMRGEIIIDCQTQTNVPGVFAAGDVTNVLEKQIIIAAGEGAKAALNAFRYLGRMR